jgi:hypothetical protein
MTLREMVSSRFQGVARFARLERVLAALCLFIPVFLIWFDTGPFDNGRIRDTISHYYNMEENQVFYFPLTVASMLFVVNGVIKQRHIYNTLLGGMLAGVILFNRDDFNRLHTIFAAAFFVGNAVVIIVFSSKKELWFKALLVAALVISMLGCFVFGWFTQFWAEWLSLGIIALHFILESRAS